MTPNAVVKLHATIGVPTPGSMPRGQAEPFAGPAVPPVPLMLRSVPRRGDLPPGRPPVAPEDGGSELGDVVAPVAGWGAGLGVAPGVGSVVDVGFGVVAGFGAEVGFGLGVGLGVGFGVGFGLGALMTTRRGETDERVRLRSPDPEPLVTLKRYRQVPAGKRLVSENVTPVA